jgi:ketosteroid isomerase-like protein
MAVNYRRPVDRTSVLAWIDAYERAWRAPGTDALRTLFTDDATYQLGPYEPTIAGLDEIAAMWERERDGPDEPFTIASEVVAVDGQTAVARIDVHYGGPPAREYRDLWVIRFASGGRALAFEEWPFWPGQERVASPASRD